MNLLIAIRTEFQITANSREARRALARIAATHPPLANYESLAEVVSALHTGDLRTQVELLNSLISHAKTEPLARLTIVEAFARLIGRYRVAGPVDLDDYRSELVAALLTEIDRLAGLPAHPYPATMLARAVDRAARKWRRLASQAPEPLEAISDDIDGEILIAELDGNPLQPTRLGRFLETLTSAVRAGELSTEDGSFVARRVLNGEPTLVEAKRRYMSERCAQRHLTKAIETLARHYIENAA